jgi:PAS domain S-box-containing protein
MKTNPSLLEELSRIRSHLTGPKNAPRDHDPLSAFFFAMEGLSEMVVVTDLNHKIVYVNAACEDLLGYDPEELMGLKADKYFEGIPGNPLDLARRIAEEASSGLWEGEIFNRRKDGGLITVNLKMTPLTDSSGQVLGYVGISENITERMREKKALRMSEEMLQLVIANIPQAVFWKDLKLKYIGCNKAFAEIVGLDEPEDIVGKTDYELSMTKYEADLYRECDRRVMESVVPEFRIKEHMRRADGTEAWVETNKVPLLDADGQVMGVLGTFEDITERQRAEEALRESEARNRAILNAQPDLMFVQSRDGRFLDYHAANPDILYALPEQFLGKKMQDIFPKEFTAILLDLIEQVLGSGKIQIYEYDLPIDGEPRYFEMRIVPCGEDKILSIIRDITERKLMEEELINARKLESMGTLAGGIAHDFNNILAAILGNVSYARIYAEEGSELYKPLVEAEVACLRAQGLTHQLLTFSRGGKPVKEVIRVGELLKEITEFDLHGSNVICRFEIARDLWPVEADRGQLGQVISNIVINADQAMPEGGEMEVRAENVEINKGGLLALEAGIYVKVEVVDEGVGIPREHLEKIFDPYFTTKQKGSGLGLASAYSIVKKHSGSIQAVSELGRGTTFIVYFPASKEEPKEKMMGEDVITGEGRVLLMDDEEIIRQMAARLIRKLGYEVVTALDGKEAVEKYKKAQRAGRPFGVVILDLTVKGGMGGEEALERLKGIDPEVKAIVSSGYSSDSVMSDYKAAGFAGMIAKPYSLAKISQVLKTQIYTDQKTDKHRSL